MSLDKLRKEHEEKLIEMLMKMPARAATTAPKKKGPKKKTLTTAQRCAKMEKICEDMLSSIEAQDERIADMEDKLSRIKAYAVNKKRGKK